jgi:hypothetical protein
MTFPLKMILSTFHSIQTIALLLSEPRRKPSLVVAPVVALMQWKHEIEKNAEGFTVSNHFRQLEEMMLMTFICIIRFACGMGRAD